MADFEYDQIRANKIEIQGTDESTGATSGSFVSLGGIGIGKKINGAGTSGDILIGNGVTLERLAIGSNSQVLTVVSGLPSWVTPGTVGSWADLDLDTGTPVSPVLSIPGAQELSRYITIGNIVTLSLDFQIGTDGSPAGTLLSIDIPAGKGIPAAGSGGHLHSSVVTIEKIGSSRSLGSCYISSGTSISFRTFGSFDPSSSYRIYGTLSYEI